MTATAGLSESDRHTINHLARREGCHCNSVWRWILYGVRGVKLRSIRRGGRRFVLESDWQEFCAELNADLGDAAKPSATESHKPTSRSAGRRSKESQAARDELGKLGI